MIFLIDENVHHGLFLFLKNLGYDIKLSPKKLPDEQVFYLAQNEERTLITRDSDFLLPHFTREKHSGIILIRIDPNDLDSQNSCIVKLFSKYKDILGKIFILHEQDRFEQFQEHDED